MSITIEGSIPNYSGTPSLIAEVSAPDGASVLNGGGSGTAVTNGSRFRVSFTFSDSIQSGIYEVRYLSSGVVYASGLVWIESSSGTYGINDFERMAVYQQRLQLNLESPTRSTTDVRALEFEWPVGQTWATNASTKRFQGETGSQEEPIVGVITPISGVSGWYSLAYNVADRAADATTVVPTEVTYYLEDDAGNTGTITLRIFDASAVDETVLDRILAILSGGYVAGSSPVTPTGKLRPIIIGDDYLAANERAFTWVIGEVAGATAAACTVEFKGSTSLPCGTYAFEGSNATVTDNTDGTWTVSVDLLKAETLACEPGQYDWSMALIHSGNVITKIYNSGPNDRVTLVPRPV